MEGDIKSNQDADQNGDHGSGDHDSDQIRLFLEAVHSTTGYDLRSYAPASIRRRVHAARARFGLATIGALRRRLIADPSAFPRVLEELTVRVSDMFRDPLFFRSFKTRVIPLLRTYPTINIWHAGCATGEEVYSTAILLAEENLIDRTQVFATDLSPGALRTAKEGVYPERRLGQFAQNYRSAGGTGDFARYFTSAYGRIAIRDSLRRRVVFFQHDLVSDQVFGNMHVIFCRNVMIYFNAGLRHRVLERFGQSTYPSGFLCLGSSERIPRPSSHLFGDFAPDERIYRQRSHVTGDERPGNACTSTPAIFQGPPHD